VNPDAAALRLLFLLVSLNGDNAKADVVMMSLRLEPQSKRGSTGPAVIGIGDRRLG
jgi:hypothetical protein